MEGRRLVTAIKVGQGAAADELFACARSFIKCEGKHLGGGEAFTNEPFNLVTAQGHIAVTGQTNEIGIGIPSLECGECCAGVRAQGNAVAHEDHLVSADGSVGRCSNHAPTVYDRQDA